MSSSKELDSNRLKNGDYKSFYDNGKMRESGCFKHGIKKGLWHYYYSNGSIQKYGEYSGEYFIIRNIKYTLNFFVSSLNIDTIKKEQQPIELQEYLDTILKNSKQIYPKIFHRQIGTWFFYDLSGQLVKKEYFNKKGIYRRENYKLGKIEKIEVY